MKLGRWSPLLPTVATAALLLARSRAMAQQPAPTPPVSTVIVDVQDLTDAQRASVLPQLVALTGDKTQRVTVDAHNPKSDNLFDIVNAHYRYYDSTYPRTAAALAAIIERLNGLRSIDSLKDGQQLSIPILPQRPNDRGSKLTLAQFLDTASSRRFTADIGTVYAGKLGATIRSSEERLGSTWNFLAASSSVREFLQNLPPNIRQSVLGKFIYAGPAAEMANIHVLGATEGRIPALPQSVNATVSQALASVSASQPGVYYILDFFSGIDSKQCPHGPMVFDAAIGALAEYGVLQLAQRIQKIDIDFYGNKHTGDQYMDAYLATYAQRVQPSLKKIRDELDRSKRNADFPLEEPAFYLQAVYHILLQRPDAAVISASFWTDYDGFSWVPDNYDSSSSVALLAAVADDDGTILESDSLRKEPMDQFFRASSGTGISLVGCERSPGAPMGMESNRGAVTFIERGFGLAASNTCLGANGGTSFATPRIGVDLLLARLFWESANMNVSAYDAKVRLALASDVVPIYVGHYASAGIPRLERILRKNGAYAVLPSGAIADVTIADDSFVDVTAPGFTTPDRFRFKRGDAGLCGIQIVGGQAYVFREALPMWQKADISKLLVTVQQAGAPIVMRSLDDLSKHYRGLVIL